MFLLDLVPYIPTAPDVAPDVAPDPGIFYGLVAAGVVAIIVILIIFLKKKWSFFTNNKIRKSYNNGKSKLYIKNNDTINQRNKAMLYD